VSAPFTHREEGPASVVTFDDGKANVFNDDSITSLNEALGLAAASDREVVIIAGRPGMFSAGLDLKTLPILPEEPRRLVITRFMEVMARLHTFDKPLVTAATGHALAGGCIMLLTGDVRIGASGGFKLGTNETRIGIALPTVVIRLATDVLPVASHAGVLLHGRSHTPDEALAAGILHEVVAPDQVMARAAAIAEGLTGIDPRAYRESKRRMRAAGMEQALAKLSGELSDFFGASLGL